MATPVKRRLTRKLTRQRLQPFLKRHATRDLVLNVGAKKNGYEDLFPHTIAGDIMYYPTIDVQFDGHCLPFAGASIGIIVCTEVLEHCIEPQRVIDEFYRVLQPGGKLILTTRFVFPLHDAPYDYYRFTRYGLAHLCRRFDSVTIEPEAQTVETLGILLQRLAAQGRWRLPGSELLLQLAARIVFRLEWNLRAEYGDISKRASEAAIMASGFYLVAIKTLEPSCA